MADPPQRPWLKARLLRLKWDWRLLLPLKYQEEPQ
jgi:hypothetical protein